jgi:hypothetical protein
MLQKSDRPSFADVARLIAGSFVPDWLVADLASMAKFIRIPESEGGNEVEIRMVQSARYLESWLAMYGELEDRFGFACPDCVDQVASALPELIEVLMANIEPTRAGAPSDRRKEICAGVIVGAWHRLHGQVRPSGKGVTEACIAYWLACGWPETEKDCDPDNWRRYAERTYTMPRK